MTSSRGATANSTGQPRREPELVDAVDVVGIGERDPERVVVERVRDRADALEHRERDQLGRLGRDAGDGEVDERQAVDCSASCRARSRSSRLVGVALGVGRLREAPAAATRAGRPSAASCGAVAVSSSPTGSGRSRLRASIPGSLVRSGGRCSCPLLSRGPRYASRIGVAGEEGDDGAAREERAERDRHLARRAAVAGEQDRRRARAQRACRPSARPEACVPSAAPSSSASLTSPIPMPARIGERGEQQEQRTPRDRGDRPGRRRMRRACAPRARRRRPGSTIAVRDHAPLEVGRRDRRRATRRRTRDERRVGGERRSARRQPATSSAVPSSTSGYFTGIVRRQRAAAAAQQQVRDDRDVVVPARSSVRARGRQAERGLDDRQVRGHPRGDHVEEAPDREPGQRTRRRGERRRSSRARRRACREERVQRGSSSGVAATPAVAPRAAPVRGGACLLRAGRARSGSRARSVRRSRPSRGRRGRAIVEVDQRLRERLHVVERRRP